jgi:serine/threonine protein kinase
VEGDVLYHHIHTDPTSPRRLNPTIPLWLDAIVLRTMLKVPEKRFPSVADLLNAVEECLRSVRTGPFLEAGPR